VVTDDAHKWMLLTEGDKQVFSENLQSFIHYWESREPKFTAYFRQNYAPRYSKKYCTGIADLTGQLTEKWALSYRHFDHKDTDTNMFVERYCLFNTNIYILTALFANVAFITS
jgi:hypothetical protein